MNNLAYGFDTETTGVDTATCRCVEVALVGNGLDYCTLVACPIPIPPDASGIHHICNEDLVHAPSWEVVKQELAAHATQTPLPVFVAHNCQYDKAVLGEFVPVLWVCTYKVGLRLFPGAPNHKNETLRYFLGLPGRGRSGSQGSHSARHDATVTLQLFHFFLTLTTLEQMLEWTEQPAKLPYMPMGKHFKQDWSTIPAPYLQWCINQKDMREDVVYCCKSELERRKR